MGDAIQMNTRIDRTLKKNGDAALANAGYSPSQAVRLLWEFAAKHTCDPQAIRALLESGDSSSDAEEESERARRLDALLAGMNLCQNAYKRLGVTPSKFTAEASYAELREQAALERLEAGREAR